MRAVFLALLPACRAAPQPLAGTSGLRADGVVGVLRAEDGAGCGAPTLSIGLWGPGWGTDGEVPAEASEEEPGVIWVWFPLQTGAGEGAAALRLEGEQARLPLGARAGEHDILMRRGPELPDGLDAAAAASAAAVATERESWAKGAFLLMDGDAVVGDLQMRGEQAPILAVYDAAWLTPDPVEAARRDEGADLLLSFPAEPSFGDEDALLRVNVPTREVVVPADATPTEYDRRLHLEPGAQADRPGAIAAAREASRALEQGQLDDLLPRLARAALRPDGSCADYGAVDPAWKLLLRGYDVAISAVSTEAGPACAVEVEPSRKQHGRQLRARSDGS